MDPRDLLEIRTRLALEHAKWDPQVGDRSALCPHPLFVNAATWKQLASWSDALAAEITGAEWELAHQPELQAALGAPRQLRAALARGAREGFTPCAARVMRFDFHQTTEGWRVSEVNSDVPGGYTEASAFTRFMAALHPPAQMSGDPLAAWTRAMSTGLDGARRVALMSAPGYLEDQQVTASLGAALREHGIEVSFVHRPEQIEWRRGRALLRARSAPLGAIVRFYQAEWLVRFPRRRWIRFFVGGRTPVSNHGPAALTESKRLQLVRQRLNAAMPTARALFPCAADPRDVDWSDDDSWVLKGAYSNTGDEIFVRQHIEREGWKALVGKVRSQPERWVLQRRFEPVPVASAMGPLFPCIGVYVIDGGVAGAYARVATEPIVDYRAMDAALLVVEGQS